MPQKRRKTSQEPADETVPEKQPIIKQLESCSAKVDSSSSANNLPEQTDDLKAAITKTIGDLIKVLEFDSSQ